jgi:glutamine amidotransferase-like uncharacterized protein
VKLVLGKVLATLVLATPHPVAAHADLPVGLYAGPGTWAVGVTALGAFLDTFEVPWNLVYPAALNQTDFSSDYSGIIIPGGYAGDYVSRISPDGNREIRELVSGGGFYIGICAGGYYACDRIIWEGVPYDMPLDVFPGEGVGAIDEIMPWPQYTMTTVLLNPDHPINEGGNLHEEILYYGGASFFPNPGQGMDTVGVWQVTGDAAIVTCGYGNGRVCLWGPHPEIEEDSDRDGSSWGDPLDDNGSDWPLLKAALEWVCANATAVPGSGPGGASVLAGVGLPNPFRHETEIRLSLPERGGSSVRVYDVRGHLVRELLDSSLAAREHTVQWDGRGDNGAFVAAGVYFARIESAGSSLTRKLTVIR